MEEGKRRRAAHSVPFRIGFEEAAISDIARELYTACFFHPEWLTGHAPVGGNDPFCAKCGGDEGFDLPNAPFRFGIHVILNEQQWYSAVLCANCYDTLLLELRNVADF